MKFSAYAAASGQTIIAAGTFLVAKDATAHFSPLALVWFRVMLSALLVGSVYAVTHRRRARPPRSLWPRLALLGVLGVSLNQSAFIFGINQSTPLHASLLYAFTPVLVLTGAVLWGRERFRVGRAAGVVLAVSGVALVLSAQGLNWNAGPFRGDLMILLAVTAWAAYTLLGKDVLRGLDPFTVITYAFVFAAFTMLPLAPWVFRDFSWQAPGVRGWLGVLYLSGMTSGVAFTLWYFALKRLEASQLAVFNNLQAPLTALLAWWMLGAVPTQQVLFGGALVLLGVSLVQAPWARWAAGPAARKQPAPPGS